MTGRVTHNKKWERCFGLSYQVADYHLSRDVVVLSLLDSLSLLPHTHTQHAPFGCTGNLRRSTNYHESAAPVRSASAGYS